MPDIIQLLPDSVANQIAAGEVVQRPASAVKELLENAIDAKATVIKLIVKDAGKTLIQVIDNGKGMSETDARMCFERHATSKIKEAQDLFNITTKGFRGEALASIAAIAQVELKTKTHESNLGTYIEIHGSELKNQEAVSCASGTSFSIKNLFYNVPARRNFLKSDTVELSHITNEFLRVVLAHPEIEFHFSHNNKVLYHLPISVLRQRIVSVFGTSLNEKLIPVEEETSIVKITGFTAKPEMARKTRGEQYFFVNNRFIKNSYLHHAIQHAYDGLIAKDSFVSYFIFIEINPATIDINIHPTKTEIKFEDEKAVYAILRSSVKKALGKNNISPAIDFDQEATLYNIPARPAHEPVQAPKIKVDTSYNPFSKSEPTKPSKSNDKLLINKGWEDFVKDTLATNVAVPKPEQTAIPAFTETHNTIEKAFQFQQKYIVTTIKSGIVIIDQQAAHERILFEQLMKNITLKKSQSQQLLFPKTIELSPQNTVLLTELLDDLKLIGFDITSFSQNTFIIHGIPSIIKESEVEPVIESVLEESKYNTSSVKLKQQQTIIKTIAKKQAIKAGKILSEEERSLIINELFACENPYLSPSDKPTIVTFPIEELEKKFKK